MYQFKLFEDGKHIDTWNFDNIDNAIDSIYNKTLLFENKHYEIVGNGFIAKFTYLNDKIHKVVKNKLKNDITIKCETLINSEYITTKYETNKYYSQDLILYLENNINVKNIGLIKAK